MLYAFICPYLLVNIKFNYITNNYLKRAETVWLKRVYFIHTFYCANTTLITIKRRTLGRTRDAGTQDVTLC